MKKIKENYGLLLAIIFLVLLISAFFILYSQKNYNISNNDSLRIASLSPSITEYIYDLGLDKFLIANTTYCNYPEQAKNKEKIGTFSDINYEQIAKLQINTAIIHEHMADQKTHLESMGIKVVVVNNNTIDEILTSYDILGKAFHIEEKADKRKKEIENNINKVKASIKKGKKHKAVVSIFRNYGSKVTSLTIAGGNNIYNDILNILNLENPYKDYMPYTEVSIESIISSNPYVIFDMFHGRDTTYAYNDWKDIPLYAEKNNKIIILNDTYLSLPGPRIDKIIEKFANEYIKVNND